MTSPNLCTEGKARSRPLATDRTGDHVGAAFDGLHAYPGNRPSGDDTNSSCTGAMDVASPRHRQEARPGGGWRSGGAKVIRCLMARGVGHGEIVAYLDDTLFEVHQTTAPRASRSALAELPTVQP